MCYFYILGIFPEFHKVSSISDYSVPFQVDSMTDTSDGKLVMTGLTNQAVIYTKQGQQDYTITIPGAGNMYGVARQGDILFFTDSNGLIHIVRETGEYIKNISTAFKAVYGIDVTNNTIWLADSSKGVYKLTVDSCHNIIKSEILASPTSQFHGHRGITIYNDSRVIVVCRGSHNLQVFDMSGLRVLPPVGEEGSEDGQLLEPQDVVTDGAGRMYVADSRNQRIVLFSKGGEFLRNLVTTDDGLRGNPTALFLQDNYIYASTYTIQPRSFKFYIIKLM